MGRSGKQKGRESRTPSSLATDTWPLSIVKDRTRDSLPALLPLLEPRFPHAQRPPPYRDKACYSLTPFCRRPNLRTPSTLLTPETLWAVTPTFHPQLPPPGILWLILLLAPPDEKEPGSQGKCLVLFHDVLGPCFFPFPRPWLTLCMSTSPSRMWQRQVMRRGAPWPGAWVWGRGHSP